MTNKDIIRKINKFLGEEVVSSSSTTTMNIDRTPFKGGPNFPIIRRRKKSLLGKEITD